MFGNIPYFIIVLLIYATYPIPESQPLPTGETLFLFALLSTVFATATWLAFQRLGRRAKLAAWRDSDARLDALTTRQTIMAVIVFAVEIYGLGLPALTQRIRLLKQVPTLEAAVFLAVFIGYLAIVWACAYNSYRTHDSDRGSRREYIASNLSFSLPVLLPWFILSGIADLVNLLPLPALQSALASPLGQAAYFVFFLVVVALFGPVLIQRFWGCRPLSPGPVRSRIETFCARAGVKYADILSWPLFGGRMLTAGVMGLIARFRYILITPALIRFLDPVEMEAVMAHEIGHIKKKHLLFYLFFFISLMPMILLSYALFNQLISFLVIYVKPLYRLIGGSGLRWIVENPGVNAAFIVTLFYFYFRYIFGYFMRNFERQADIFAYDLIGSAVPLITSLKKIAVVSGQSPDRPNWHHFSISERVGYLAGCESDRRCIRRHESKLRFSIIAYLAGMMLIAGAYYQMGYGVSGEKISAYLIETLLSREIEAEPDNAELYGELGDVHYILLKNYPAAIKAYEASLTLEPDAPDILNNLAWLYATCEDAAFRNPPRALALAKRATQLRPADYILDTLAEAYFINGETEKALAAARQALAVASPRKRAVYEARVERFENGLSRSRQPQSGGSE